MKIALIKKEKDKLIFECPEEVNLEPGDQVICATKQGEITGTVLMVSIMANDTNIEPLTRAFGTPAPLRKIVGKFVVERFDRKEVADDGVEAEACHCEWNSYTDREIMDAVCELGCCTSEAGTGKRRKADCPLYGMPAQEGCYKYTRDHPEMRQVLIEYLRAEGVRAQDIDEEESEPEPEDPWVECTMKDLKEMSCNMGLCMSLCNNAPMLFGGRKADCPLFKIANMEKHQDGICTYYIETHPEMRQTLVDYLKAEGVEPPKKSEEPECLNS